MKAGEGNWISQSRYFAEATDYSCGETNDKRDSEECGKATRRWFDSAAGQKKKS
jgi:hypothetical protein